MKNAPRQYRNQRLGKAKPRNQQVLEVSVRREKEQVRRVRSVIGGIAKLILFAALAVAAWVGTREGLRRFLWNNPVFFITDIHAKSDGSLTREQILQLGGVVEGTNYFVFDTKKVRASLAALPQVDRVDVQTTFPHRLEIEIWERQPVAWLTEEAGVDPTTTDRSFLIDRRGWVLKPRKNQDYLPLPIISGVEVGNLVPGRKASALQINSALELLRQNNGNANWQIRSIDVKKKYCMVVTDRNHAEITFGLDEIDKQLSKLSRLLEYLEPQHREIQTVNLLVKYNTPVTFFDDPGDEPPAPDPIASKKSESGKEKPKSDTKSSSEKSSAKATPVARAVAVSTPPPSSRSSESSRKSTESSKKPAPKSGKKSSVDHLRKPFRLNE
jgi:cell division septal protein FtsQ